MNAAPTPAGPDTPAPPQTRGTAGRRRWRAAAVAFGLALMASLGWMLWGWLAARAELARARAALEADDPAAAAVHLEAYLSARPTSAEGHFRAGQAARLRGEFRDAIDHLDAAADLGWDPAAVELERALVRAQRGDLRSVEQTLARAVGDRHPDSRHVLAVLVPALMAEFRWVEANALAERWTEIQPGSARPWAYWGEILERLRRKGEAVSAFREAVRRDPQDRRARFNLARMLVEAQQEPDEAASHLEWLRQAEPDNPAIPVQLAVCREIQGRPDQAGEILDAVISSGTRDASAYYHRGRLELNSGRPGVAVGFLRRAADLDPGDVETLHALFLCLQRVGSREEAAQAEERWKRADADLKRASDLARAIWASPRDPDLRREMGELFLRNGRDRDGLRWLESALRERPDHEPTHRVLADYYDRTGHPDLAAHHRAFTATRKDAAR